MEKLTAPVALVILDGWGIGKADDPNNAIAVANTPVMDGLLAKYPNTSLACSGEAVGLPDGQMGNSEVGHLNIGAGRVVYQELTRITKAIREGEFFENPVLLDVIAKAKVAGGALHLMGLLSNGGVHSHNTHLYALLELAKKQGVKDVYVHAFLDGRDVPPSSAVEFIEALEEKIAEIGVGKIATVSGRYYAMDRDKRWDRVEKAYLAIACAEGNKATTAVECVKNSYADDKTDEFVVPTVIGDYTGMNAKDGAIFFNFRPDRARELTHAFTDVEFDGFARQKGYMEIAFATMTQYEKGLNVEIAYNPQTLTNTFGEVLRDNGLKQLRIAETEKYAHVTFFFNGGVEAPLENEQRILVPSPKVATYDLQPEMSAIEVTDKVVAEIEAKNHDVIILNYANGDMVGHTGVIPAAIKAVETVDTCVGRLVDAMLKIGGTVCITADHGNADQMVDPITGGPFTAHTTNKVPFIVVGKDKIGRTVNNGRLADIAPTILDIIGIKVPTEMTGKSLLK
ncbi:2,3-bisphosphoglycerate-independent phosphoglycerate mutase [Anaerosinus sp.]|uniref:2,3-bisphosphoglycerate-independent phosphoglycerate mutase n=1 Tax=Selenobaculum sp. TaxID=3074374 RepID=UPI0015AF77AB